MVPACSGKLRKNTTFKVGTILLKKSSRIELAIEVNSSIFLQEIYRMSYRISPVQPNRYSAMFSRMIFTPCCTASQRDIPIFRIRKSPLIIFHFKNLS